MKAFALTRFGVPPSFVEVPELEPGDDEVLVRVHATSVNPVDELIGRGFFRGRQEHRFPAVLGRDVAGVVERVGSVVTQHTVGDRVFGFVKRDHIGDGTFADGVVCPQDMFLAPVPEGTTFAEAGVLGQSGVTALECIDAVPAERGHIVLVNGASGGVGSFAVQIAKARGATVVATGRSPEQEAYLRSLGADNVVDWSAGDLTGQVRALAPDGIDGFVDLVRHVDSAEMGVGEEQGQKLFAELCHAILRSGGRAVSLTNSGVPELMGSIPFANVHSTPTRGSLERVAALVAEGAVRIPIQQTFRFADLPEAFAALGARPSLGKISVVLENSFDTGSRS